MQPVEVAGAVVVASDVGLVDPNYSGPIALVDGRPSPAIEVSPNTHDPLPGIALSAPAGRMLWIHWWRVTFWWPATKAGWGTARLYGWNLPDLTAFSVGVAAGELLTVGGWLSVGQDFTAPCRVNAVGPWCSSSGPPTLAYFDLGYDIAP